MDRNFQCLLILSLVSILGCMQLKALPTRHEKTIKEIVVTEGEEFTLPCSAYQITVCTWKKNGNLILTMSHARYSYKSPVFFYDDDYTLLIHNATTVDQGTWECICYGTNFEKVRTSQVFVTVISNTTEETGTDFFENHPKNVTVKQGEHFYLSCALIIMGTCRWNRETVSEFNTTDFSTNNKHLYLKAEKHHEGRWRCICISKLTSFVLESNDAWVTVISENPKRQEQNSVNVTIHAGQDFVLHCNYEDGDRCFWRHNNMYIYAFSHSRISYEHGAILDWSIRVRNAKKEDQGHWECSCYPKNVFSPVKHNKTVITVLEVDAGNSTELLLLRNPESLTVEEDHPLILSAFFNQPVLCHWVHSHSSLTTITYRILEARRNCTLTIENAAGRDEGLWSVVGVLPSDDEINKSSDHVMVHVVPTKLAKCHGDPLSYQIPLLKEENGGNDNITGNSDAI